MNRSYERRSQSSASNLNMMDFVARPIYGPIYKEPKMDQGPISPKMAKIAAGQERQKSQARRG